MENSKHLDIIEKSLHDICQEEILDNELNIKLISVLALFDIAKDINRKQLQLAYTRGKNDVLQEIVNRSFTITPETDPPKKEFDDISKHMRSILKINLAKNYNLSTRIKNVLKWSEIVTVGDLVSYEKEEIQKKRQLGQQSFEYLENIVDRLGLNFGMNLEKYRLHED